MSTFNRILGSKPSWIVRYGVAVLSATLALVISQWTVPHIGFTGTLFLGVVMLSAWYGGVGPGLLATTISSLVYHYYFLHPSFSLGPRPPELPRLSLYIASNLLIGLLSATQRNAKEALRRAHDDLKRTVQDLENANDALQAESREREQTKAALQQSQADLAHANRVSSMGELTASLAHEVNQPITAAVLDANACLLWLSRDQPNLEEARAAASRIVHDGKRVGEIVNHVRLLFTKDTLQRELVDLNDIIRQMILLLYSEVTQFAVFIRTELTANLPLVMGDRVQLQQVLMNLMMNSIEAMKDVDGARELTIQSQRDEDGQVLISVNDTGVGLPQQADKIFRAFFTTKTRGTGMGLRISRSIVESHGGRLWAVDNLPRGARFCFTLPADGGIRDSTESENHTDSEDTFHANYPIVGIMDMERTARPN